MRIPKLQSLRWLLGVGLMLAAASSEASVSLFPFQTQVETSTGSGEVSLAKAGEAYAGVLVLRCEAEIDVYDFTLAGDGWAVQRFDAPANQIVDPGQTLRIPFEATPSDPNAPLHLDFTAGNRKVRQSLDMGPSMRARWQRDASTLVSRTNDGQFVEARGIDLSNTDEGGVAKARTINVSGRHRYTREDNQEIGSFRLKVELWDDNGVLPHGLLSTTTTGGDGAFSFSISWPEAFYDPDPDLYLKFITDHANVITRPEGVWPFVGPYTWTTSITQNYSGTNLSFGDILPVSESDNMVLHIHTTGSRAWRFLNVTSGLSAPKITYLFPSPNWPAYNQFFQEIYVPEDYDDGSTNGINFQWRESTLTHEFGHHVINNFAQPTIPDYCNSICDEQSEGWIWELDCGHCAWCEENPTDAWAEGWPNWFADATTRDYASTYGVGADYSRSQENLRSCVDSDGNSCPCDPWETEGFLGALLRDIEDSGAEDADGDGFGDALSLGSDEIFEITTDFNPTTPLEFINAFRAAFPQHNENLWETAFNVGYQIDSSNPGAVSNFTSSSHTSGGSSTDPTVSLTWGHASDDMSGIAGYSFLVSTTGPTFPNAVADLGKVTSTTTSTLAAGGTYWFNIRAIDRAGRASSTYRSFGPVTIVAPDPANFAFYERTGWDEPVLPRLTNDTSNSSAPAPTTLSRSASYINLSAQNDGQTSAPGQTTRIYVDGKYVYWLSWGTINPGVKFTARNYGPLAIRGGRHTFEARLDAIEAVDETNETDNDFGLQWIWEPEPLTSSTPITRSRPQDAQAGWPSLPAGVTRWYNADGYRFTSQSGFSATFITPSSTTADLDLRMHLPSTGATSGFTTNVGYSTRAAGCLDAVVTNSRNTGVTDFDVGVLNRYNAGGNYTIETRHAGGMLFGDSVTVAVPEKEHLIMREVKFLAGDEGPVSISLQVDPSEGPWHVAWFDDTFSRGDVLDHDGFATTDADGRARIDVTVATAAYHGLMIFRDPKDGTPATSVTFEVQRTPPDVLAYQAAGWHAPLVPRPADDGTTGSVPVPATLAGDQASTYLNVATRNESPTGMGGLRAHVHLDGVYTWWLTWGSFGANATSLFNWSSPWTVRGGRHTLSVHHDANSTYEELSELNNVSGEQYVWNPTTLAMGATVNRSLPPTRTGGWDDITSSETRWYNADGLRTPTFAPSGKSGYWGLVAAMPTASANVDVRLHEVSTGSKDGFASNLVYSGYGTGLADYVLVNFHETGFRAFDAGFLRLSGSGSYHAQVEESVWLSNGGLGTYGPYDLEAGKIAEVYEFILAPGVYTLQVENRSENTDLALGVHAGGATYRNRSAMAQLGSIAEGAEGEDEFVTFEVPTTEVYAVVVHKPDAANLNRAGEYVLHLRTGATAVDPPTVAVDRTGLVAITPNPFNPTTAIEFALQSTMEVRLEVYNLRGELVRVLARESRAAGTHSVRWDGRDEQGNTVSSGVYMARLSAGGIEDRRKMVLVK